MRFGLTTCKRIALPLLARQRLQPVRMTSEGAVGEPLVVVSSSPSEVVSATTSANETLVVLGGEPAPLSTYAYEDEAVKAEWEAMFTIKEANSVKDANVTLSADIPRETLVVTPAQPPESEEDGWVVASPEEQRARLARRREEARKHSTTLTEPAEVPKMSASAMMSELSVFTLPLLLVWLASPLLSLADSTFVGALRSTTELAALGPACALTDNAYFAATFNSVVTTSAVATACARKDAEGAKAAAAAACVAASVVGVALAVSFAVSPVGQAALSALIGSNGASPEFCAEALAYVKARALGFPFALVSSGLQAASLARRDVRLPIKASAVSGVVNLLGDALLVPTSGVVGAAIATTVAQIVACGVVVRDSLRKGYLGLRPVFGTAAAKTKRALGTIATRGLPVLATLLAKCAVLSALAYSATASATDRGALAEIAAHQVFVGLYFVFAPVGDALSQTVQTFCPRALEQQQVRGRNEESSHNDDDRRRRRRPPPVVVGPAARDVISGALRASVVLGAVDAVLAYVLPVFAPFVFTRDAAVVAALRENAPLLSLSLLLHAATSSLEGTMLACRDAKFLSTLYTLDAAVVAAAFIALAAASAPLNAIWSCFFAYQVVRLTQFAARVATTSMRRRRSPDDDHRPTNLVPLAPGAAAAAAAAAA
ncbi:hypothetical protein CTAYLR_005214 [Chrysophaeum taylorii]|uniref:Protein DETOXIFICATION n=1 Tax=Chrysophaeum taylorii TaxID=2483200 RepID=A0AAD7UCT8_9STRA|nr:hypothetical protein CTAYLR_005214 [Chrysophaeum taylorii]